jgi:hypothetical protein
MTQAIGTVAMLRGSHSEVKIDRFGVNTEDKNQQNLLI